MKKSHCDSLVGRLYRAVILLGLDLYHPSISVSSVLMVLYVFKKSHCDSPVGRLYRAVILLGLDLYHPSISVSSVLMVLYVLKNHTATHWLVDCIGL